MLPLRKSGAERGSGWTGMTIERCVEKLRAGGQRVVFRDGNGNVATLSVWGTEERARASLESLSLCVGCTDCETCANCRFCYACRDCAGCSECIGCKDCEDCRSCRFCLTCRDCAECSDCAGCRGSARCRRCYDCDRCEDCERCEPVYASAVYAEETAEAIRRTTDCVRCEDCHGCTGCTGCRNCHQCDGCTGCSNTEHLSDGRDFDGNAGASAPVPVAETASVPETVREGLFARIRTVLRRSRTGRRAGRTASGFFRRGDDGR